MKKLYMIVALIVAFSITQTSIAQIAAYYTFSESTGTYTPITTGTTSGFGDNDDGEITDLPIGFSFDYYGTTYDTLNIGVNGAISFTQTNITWTNNLATSSNTGINLLAPLWDDLNHLTADTAEIRWELSGTSPNQIFTIQYKNISWRTQGNYVNFQVVLHETSNLIEYKYGPSTSTDVRTASIGLNGSAGNDFISITPGATGATTSTTTSNNSISSADYPGDGTIYSFTYGPPTCFKPYGQYLQSFSTNSAEVGWTDTNSASSWQIEYDVTGFTQGTGTTAIVSNNLTTISSLTPGTSYEFYVRTICGPGDSSNWDGPFEFTTQCSAMTIPYNEGFNSGSSTLNCWTIFDGNNDGDTWGINTSSSYVSEGDQSMGINTDFNGGNDYDFLVSPSIQLTGNERVRFSHRVRASNEPNQYKVLIIDDINNPTFIDTLLSDTSDLTSYVEETIDISSYTGTHHIAFLVDTSSFDGWILFIDDFNVETIPSCLTPTSISFTNVTSTTGTVKWTAGGSETQWAYEGGLTGFTPGSGLLSGTVNTDSLDVFGMTPNTSYDFYIRAICAVGDSSTWIGPFTATTNCAVYSAPYLEDFTTFIPDCWESATGGPAIQGPTAIAGNSWIDDGFANNSASGAIKINLYSTGKEDWMISPEIAVTNNNFLEFDLALNDYASTTPASLGSDDSLVVVALTDTGNVILAVYDSSSTTAVGGDHISLSLLQFVGDTIRIGFYGTEGSVNDPEDIDVSVDNFEILINPCAGFTATVNKLSDATCTAGTDGALEVTTNNGTAPFTYAWSNGSTTSTINMLAAGTYTVTVTDANACTTIDSMTINAVDTVAPMAVPYQNIMVYLDANGSASLVASSADSASSDNCAIANTTISTSSFDCSHVGNNMVYLMVEDNFSNIDSAAFNVVVMDTMSPVVTTANDTIYLDTNGNAMADSASIITAVTDNCGIDSIALSQLNFDCSTTGLQNVTVSAYDMAGNVTMVNVSIHVMDTMAPAIMCMGDTTICEGTLNLTTPSFTDNCSATIAQTAGPTDGSTVTAGTYTIEYTATDASGNTASCEYTVTVNGAPVVDLGADTLNVTLGDSVNLDADNFTTYDWSTGDNSQMINFFATADETIWVVVTDANGCTGSDTIFISVVSNVEEVASMGTFDVYPNPSVTEVNFVLNENLSNVSIQLVDITGKVVLQETRNTILSGTTTTLKVDGLAKGTYLLMVQSAEKNYLSKMIKK